MRTEGVRGLWKGWGPNVQRAYIVNAVELATYDQAKQVGTLTPPMSEPWMSLAWQLQ